MSINSVLKNAAVILFGNRKYNFFPPKFESTSIISEVIIFLNVLQNIKSTNEAQTNLTEQPVCIQLFLMPFAKTYKRHCIIFMDHLC